MPSSVRAHTTATSATVPLVIHLAAVEHPVGSPSRRGAPGAHRPGVGARVGLGQTEAADGLPGRHGREPLLLVLLAAVPVDREHRQRSLHRHQAAQAGVDGLQLVTRHAVGHHRRPGAAVTGQVHAEQAQGPELLGQLAGRDLARLEPPGDVRTEPSSPKRRTVSRMARSSSSSISSMPTRSSGACGQARLRRSPRIRCSTISCRHGPRSRCASARPTESPRSGGRQPSTEAVRARQPHASGDSARTPQAVRPRRGGRRRRPRDRDGEFFSMLGPSGSGKTTCSDGGRLRGSVGGHRLLGGDDVTRLAPFERDVCTVFQDYALFPSMNVRDNVAYGLRVRGVGRAEAHRRPTRRWQGCGWRVRRPQARPAFRRAAPAGRSGAGARRAARRSCCSTSRSARSTSSCARRCRSS